METKEQQILRLLNEGKPYTQIQNILHVSPSKIAKIKKDYYDCNREIEDDYEDDTTSLEISDDDIFGNTGSDDGSDGSAYLSSIYPENDSRNRSDGSAFIRQNEQSMNNTGNSHRQITNDLLNIQNFEQMNEDNPYRNENQVQNNSIELLKHKLDLEHELKLMKLENEREELEFKKEQLRTQKDREFSERKNKEKTFIKRFRQLCSKMQDGEWVTDEWLDFVEDAEQLNEAIEQFCIKHDYNTENLRIVILLNTFLKEFDKITESLDVDTDYITVRFGYKLNKLTKEAQNLEFND